MLGLVVGEDLVIVSGCKIVGRGGVAHMFPTYPASAPGGRCGNPWVGGMYLAVGVVATAILVSEWRTSVGFAEGWRAYS